MTTVSTKEQRMTYQNNRQINKEQFFTQEETAAQISYYLQRLPFFSNVTNIIEPSAGDGVWLDYLPITEAYDIDPKHKDVTKADYLKTSIPYRKGTLFVGNPPFGRRGSLALKFINKAANEADWIAFILPASFGKRTLQNSVHQNLHLIHQSHLFDEKFRLDDGEKVIRTVFQIWERRDYPRTKIEIKLTTDDFTFTTPENAHFAYVTHGYSHGKIKEDNLQNLTTTTHSFIKVTEGLDPDVIKERLQNIDFRRWSQFSTNQPVISRAEIVELYEESYK